jgi:glutamate 5-kinase
MKIVVKVEITSLLTPQGKFDKKKLERLTMVLTNMRNSGIEILVVSSGAIFLGAAKLEFDNIPADRIQKQAVAAVGQVELMKYYRHYFDIFNQVAAQVLLTNDVVKNPVRNRNAKNTLTNLLSKKIIPIINENDSVSTDDIELDDNYYMVLNVASIVDAELILAKSEENGKFLLIHRGSKFENIIVNENKLIETISNVQEKISYGKYLSEPFPSDFNKLSFNF